VKLFEHQVVLRVLVIDELFEAVRDQSDTVAAHRVLPFATAIGEDRVGDARLIVLSAFRCLAVPFLLLN